MSVVYQIEEMAIDEDTDKPLRDVIITDCGNYLYIFTMYDFRNSADTLKF